MSSLRLALKKSLQESGISSSSKQKQRDQERRDVVLRRREKRRPGEPPRKRGRPRKHPLPENSSSKESNNNSHSTEVDLRRQTTQESSDENEFSDSNESLDKIEEDDNESETIRKHQNDQLSTDGKINMDTSSLGESAIGSSRVTAERAETLREEETPSRKQNKPNKKIKRDSAAKLIQSQWKEKSRISNDSNANVDSGEQNLRSNPKTPSRCVSPNSSHAKSTETQLTTQSSTQKKSGKRDTVPAPLLQVIEWISGMSSKKQRKNMVNGLRVKVRFATKIRKRDGKIIKKHKWYGGLVTEVSPNKKKIQITYDDGTVEVAKFPDKDIVVDDEENESHKVSANAFLPVAVEFYMEEEEEVTVKETFKKKKPKSERDKDSKAVARAEPVDKVISEVVSKSKSNPQTVSPLRRGSESDSKSQQPTRETETDEGTLSEVVVSESTERKNFSTNNNTEIPTVIAKENGSSVENSTSTCTDDTEEEKNIRLEIKPAQSLGIYEVKATGETQLSGLGEHTEESSYDDVGEMEVIAEGSGIPENIIRKDNPKTTASVSKPQGDPPTKKGRKLSVNIRMSSSKNDTVDGNSNTSHKRKIGKEKRGVEDNEKVYLQPVKKFKKNGKSKMEPNNINFEDKRVGVNDKTAKRKQGKNEIPNADSKQFMDKNSGKQFNSLKRKRQNERMSSNGINPSYSSADPHVTRTKNSLSVDDTTKSIFTTPKKVDGKVKDTIRDNKHLYTSMPESSVSEKKEKKRKDRKEIHKEVVSTETSVITDKGDGGDNSNPQRTGRRAAQQANERINSRQEIITQQHGNKSKKKKAEKFDGKRVQLSIKKKRKAIESGLDVTDDNNEWVQCDKCFKWRVLPSSVNVDSLPKEWYCEMNYYDPNHNSCDSPEQTIQEIAKASRKAKRRRARRERQEAEAAAAATAGTLTAAVSDDGDLVQSKILAKERSQSPMTTERGESKTKNEDKKNEDLKNRVSTCSNGSEEDNNSSQTDSGSDVVKESKKNQRPRLQEEDTMVNTDINGSIKGKQRGRRRMGRDGKEEKGKNGKSSKGSDENQEWVQCDKCEKWRRLPPHISASQLPDVWVCSMNNWDTNTSSCDAVEDKADPKTHRTVNPFGYIGAHKLSYRSLIFGGTRKMHRPVSERMRAAESLFSSTSCETSENAGNYPKVMYANSSMFVNRSNAARAEEREGEKFSFLTLMSHSNLWAELRESSNQLNDSKESVPDSGLDDLQQNGREISYSSLPPVRKKEIKEMVFHVLGNSEMVSSDVLFEVQCRPWEGVPRIWFELRSICTIELTLASLLDLVQDGRVEMSSEHKEKISVLATVPRFRRVVNPQNSELSEQELEANKSRHMKIGKPWKQ